MRKQRNLDAAAALREHVRHGQHAEVPTREVFAWPESADQLLGQLESFVRHHADDPKLVLVIWGRTATESEIYGVLNAHRKRAAAVELFNQRLDLWS